MEFNKVLSFLFIFQKVLYLEKENNRDLFQCSLHLKKKIKNVNGECSFVLFSCYILKLHILP